VHKHDDLLRQNTNFFFSSRRRHTRSKRDWSSDVCSSDLNGHESKPPDGPINCGTPSAHGGNMDTKQITEGATLYFPVFQEGALFATGDFHAAMGDGEVSGTGIEVAGEVTVTYEDIKETPIHHPLLETDEGISFLLSAETLDEANTTAVQEMINILLTQIL